MKIDKDSIILQAWKKALDVATALNRSALKTQGANVHWIPSIRSQDGLVAVCAEAVTEFDAQNIVGALLCLGALEDRNAIEISRFNPPFKTIPDKWTITIDAEKIKRGELKFIPIP